MAVSSKWLYRTCAGGLLMIGGSLVAAYVTAPPPKIAAPLPALNVSPKELTLAGNSSGAFMAIQAHVAYSSMFRGVASIGGGPFYCTEGDPKIGARCIGKETPGIPTEKLVSIAKDWAQKGVIDPLENISKHKIYVFRGAIDTIIPLPVSQAVADFYAHFVKQEDIVRNFNTPAAHGWVSPYGTNTCANENILHINKCYVDVAQEFLTLFYGPLNPKKEEPLSGQVIAFDQNEFFDDKKAEAHSADEHGYAYIPASCARQEVCRAVIALHGCNQDYGKIGMIFVNQSGINQWADTNNIIVIYPQIKALNIINSFGCWDALGYSGKDFAWKSGSQVKMLKRIADRLTSGYQAPPDTSKQTTRQPSQAGVG